MSVVGTRPRSSSPSLPQPAAATAAPEVATILKNARRSIPFWAGSLMPLSASRPSRVGAAGVVVRAEGQSPEARAEWVVRAEGQSPEARAEWIVRAEGQSPEARAEWIVRAEGQSPEARAEWNSGEARAEKTQRAHPPLTLMRSLRAHPRARVMRSGMAGGRTSPGYGLVNRITQKKHGQ